MITTGSIVAFTSNDTIGYQVIEDLGDKCAVELVTSHYLKPSFICQKKDLVFLF